MNDDPKKEWLYNSVGLVLTFEEHTSLVLVLGPLEIFRPA